MTTIPLRAAGFFRFALAFACTTANAESDTEAIKIRLVALTRELMDAIPSGNADVWQRILSEDALSIDEYGRRQDKRQIVADIHPFPQGFSGSIEIRDARVNVHGDSAVLQGEFHERESVFGQKLVVRYLFSNTFVREGKDWKLIATSDVTLPTTPPALDVDGLVLADYSGIYTYGPGRALTLAVSDGQLGYTTRASGKRVALLAIARDVFMDDGEEKNLLVFRRNSAGKIHELIERRKFNDLHMMRGE
ncbi:MAG: nuclear transport factor 2 family protein [Dokdonella sp.]